MIQLVRPHRGPVTQRYANIQSDGMKHTGQDYGYTGDGQVFPEVFAAADGVVLYAGDSRALGWPNTWYFNPDFDRTDAVDSSAGNVLVLGHVQNGVPFVTTYSHLESWTVRAGDAVRASQHCATTGSTGRSTGKHLHFELLFKPLMFNTATYGRSDPNPYFIEGLAGQGTITSEEDELSDAQVERIINEINEANEAKHVTTRAKVDDAVKSINWATKLQVEGVGRVTQQLIVDNASPAAVAEQIDNAGLAKEVADELAKRLVK